MNTLNRIKEVLDQTYLMSLGVADPMGAWVADVIFVYDDNMNLYWMSDPDTRHSKALLERGDVGATITAAGGVNIKGLGVQIKGIASKVEGPRYDLACMHFKKRGKPVPAETEDVLDGDSWYVLRAEQIYLIDEANFGFKRQMWDRYAQE